MWRYLLQYLVNINVPIDQLRAQSTISVNFGRGSMTHEPILHFIANKDVSSLRTMQFLRNDSWNDNKSCSCNLFLQKTFRLLVIPGLLASNITGAVLGAVSGQLRFRHRRCNITFISTLLENLTIQPFQPSYILITSCMDTNKHSSKV